MTRKFLNLLIVFFEPRLLIPRQDWMNNWQIEERAAFQLWARVLCFGISVIYLLHYPLVDIPAHKEPLDLWLMYRVSVAAIAGTALLLSFSKRISNSYWNKLPAFIAIAFTIYMQGQSMIWRAQVPFFYVPLFGFIGVFALRMSQGKSVLTFLTFMAIAYEPFFKRPDDTQHLLSATIVTSVILIIFRSSQKTEIKNFILENEQTEANKKLIQSQLEMNAQIRAFLPKMIYRRFESLIREKRRTPLQAVDEVLRPKKVKGAVLFSDIRGFTNLTNIKGEEAVLSAIIPAQKSCTDIVERFEGIPKLAGDLVFAYYDSDESEQSIVNAVKSSVAIAQSTDSLNVRNEGKDNNIVRYIIVTYGDLIVGNLGGSEGSRDITVIGKAANLPSRIDAITKDARIKVILANAPVVLSKDSLDACKRAGLNFDTIELNLSSFSITLRDFENEKTLFLIQESEFHKIVEFEYKSRTLIDNGEVAA